MVGSGSGSGSGRASGSSSSKEHPGFRICALVKVVSTASSVAAKSYATVTVSFAQFVQM